MMLFGNRLVVARSLLRALSVWRRSKPLATLKQVHKEWKVVRMPAQV